MTLGEKIYDLRKRRGWSQEELAERCEVSRQSVSKWESGQSVPDLDKILLISDIFQVSTDYLLREQFQEFKKRAVSEPENIEIAEEQMEKSFPRENVEPAQAEKTEEQWENVRTLSREDAMDYMDLTQDSAPKIAIGVMLCILSPVVLILLGAFSEYGVFQISENAAGGIGLAVLLIMVAMAVSIFITTGFRLGKYEYLEKEPFELDEVLEYQIRDEREEHNRRFPATIVVGVVLCIMSVVPILFAMALNVSELIYCICAAALLVMVSIGVCIMIMAGMVHESFKKLLQEEDYSASNKKANGLADKVSSMYWPCIVAVFLGYSFITENWAYSWIIWPIAGVSFAVVMGICRLIEGRKAA